MILFNTQNENNEIVYLQKKRIKTKYATKLGWPYFQSDKSGLSLKVELPSVADIPI